MIKANTTGQCTCYIYHFDSTFTYSKVYSVSDQLNFTGDGPSSNVGKFNDHHRQHFVMGFS